VYWLVDSFENSHSKISERTNTHHHFECKRSILIQRVAHGQNTLEVECLTECYWNQLQPHPVGHSVTLETLVSVFCFQVGSIYLWQSSLGVRCVGGFCWDGFPVSLECLVLSSTNTRHRGVNRTALTETNVRTGSPIIQEYNLVAKVNWKHISFGTGLYTESQCNTHLV